MGDFMTSLTGAGLRLLYFGKNADYSGRDTLTQAERDEE